MSAIGMSPHVAGHGRRCSDGVAQRSEKRLERKTCIANEQCFLLIFCLTRVLGRIFNNFLFGATCTAEDVPALAAVVFACDQTERSAALVTCRDLIVVNPFGRGCEPRVSPVVKMLHVRGLARNLET